MKVKVINEFVDIHTGVLHKNGSTFECDETRYKEIENAGSIVVPVIEKVKKKEEITE